MTRRLYDHLEHYQQCDNKNSRVVLLNSSGCSTLCKWDPPLNSTYREFVMASATSRPYSGGTARSKLPTVTKVGKLMFLRRWSVLTMECVMREVGLILLQLEHSNKNGLGQSPLSIPMVDRGRCVRSRFEGLF